MFVVQKLLKNFWRQHQTLYREKIFWLQWQNIFAENFCCLVVPKSCRPQNFQSRWLNFSVQLQMNSEWALRYYYDDDAGEIFSTVIILKIRKCAFWNTLYIRYFSVQSVDFYKNYSGKISVAFNFISNVTK